MQLASNPRHLTFLNGDTHVGSTYRTARGRMGYVNGNATCSRTDLQQLQHAGGEAPEFEAAWTAYRQNLMYPLHCWAG